MFFSRENSIHQTSRAKNIPNQSKPTLLDDHDQSPFYVLKTVNRIFERMYNMQLNQARLFKSRSMLTQVNRVHCGTNRFRSRALCEDFCVSRQVWAHGTIVLCNQTWPPIGSMDRASIRSLWTVTEWGRVEVGLWKEFLKTSEFGRCMKGDECFSSENECVQMV